MKNTTAFLITLATLFALAIVSLLYLLSDKQVNHRYASFERHFIKDTLTPTHSLNLKYTGYYFAGNTTHTLYLGNTKSPAHLVAIDATLKDTLNHTLQVNTDSLAFRAIRVTVDSPFYYLSDGSKPFIYRGALGGVATPWITDARFTKAIPISSNSAILISILSYENTLVKKTRGKSPEVYPNILEEQGDGIFSTDGMLLYDKETARTVYVYYYRNEYIVLDTTLHQVLRSNTIDTITQGQIKTALITSKNSRTLAAPALKVNNHGAASRNLLYVQSNLLSRNENAEAFEQSSVTDVYNLTKQSYLYSFYLPAFKKKKATEFVCIADNLYALCGSYLVRYQLPADKNIVQ
jgi:hypothetical protein